LRWNEISPSSKAEIAAGFPSAHRKHSVFSNPFQNYAIVRQILFASILVIISVCGTLILIHNHDGSKPTTVAEGKRPRSAAKNQKRDLQSALASIERAEREYLDAIRTLSGLVDERKSFLDPILAAELDRNLKIMDRAITSAQKAYREHPADPELAQYMLRAYQKKVELLQDLALRIT
jgi:hypothetical protein